jgi:hypothetical protein
MLTFVLFGWMVTLLTLQHQNRDSPQHQQHTIMYSSTQILVVAELRWLTAKLNTHHLNDEQWGRTHQF